LSESVRETDVIDDVRAINMFWFVFLLWPVCFVLSVLLAMFVDHFVWTIALVYACPFTYPLMLMYYSKLFSITYT